MWLLVCRMKQIRSERLVSGGGVRVGWVNVMWSIRHDIYGLDQTGSCKLRRTVLRSGLGYWTVHSLRSHLFDTLWVDLTLILFKDSARTAHCPIFVSVTENSQLIFWILLATWCTNSLTFNNRTLCPLRIYVFCVYLRKNSDLCHLQHKLIDFYNRDERCLLRGTKWVFK